MDLETTQSLQNKIHIYIYIYIYIERDRERDTQRERLREEHVTGWINRLKCSNELRCECLQSTKNKRKESENFKINNNQKPKIKNDTEES